jgi:hypothetical protein
MSLAFHPPRADRRRDAQLKAGRRAPRHLARGAVLEFVLARGRAVPAVEPCDHSGEVTACRAPSWSAFAWIRSPGRLGARAAMG